MDLKHHCLIEITLHYSTAIPCDRCTNSSKIDLRFISNSSKIHLEFISLPPHPDSPLTQLEAIAILFSRGKSRTYSASYVCLGKNCFCTGAADVSQTVATDVAPKMLVTS